MFQMDGSTKHPVTPSLGGHECDFARLTGHHSFGQTREAASWLFRCKRLTWEHVACLVGGGDHARNDLGRGLS